MSSATWWQFSCFALVLSAWDYFFEEFLVWPLEYCVVQMVWRWPNECLDLVLPFSLHLYPSGVILMAAQLSHLRRATPMNSGLCFTASFAFVIWKPLRLPGHSFILGLFWKPIRISLFFPFPLFLVEDVVHTDSSSSNSEHRSVSFALSVLICVNSIEDIPSQERGSTYFIWQYQSAGSKSHNHCDCQ